MDREVALILLGEKVAATSRPVITQVALGALLDAYAAQDGAGRAPSDAEWVGTYNLNAAAAEGWRMKAGKVAGDFNFSADNASYSKADVLAHCLEMETKYASLNHGVMNVLAGRQTLPDQWDGTQIP